MRPAGSRCRWGPLQPSAAPVVAALLCAGLAGCAFRVPPPVTGATVDVPRATVPGEVRPYVDDRATPDAPLRRWFVDTGASWTTCDDDYVASLGLRVRPTGRRVVGDLGAVRVERAVLRDVTIAGWTFARLPCAVRDLDSTASVAAVPGGGPPVVGVIGANLLRHFALELDAPESGVGPPALRLRRDRQTVAGLRLRPERGIGPRLVVRLEVEGERLDAVVDTGADRTYLPVTSGEVVARWRGLRSATGDGAPRAVEVEERGGDVQMDGAPSPVSRWIVRDGDALLGMDALGAGAMLVVDWPARRLVIAAAP